MSADELLDVVNERDEVIDRRPRHEIHRLGLRHRAAHLLVFDPAGRLFLQRRSATKDMHPGCWDTSAAGHVDAGETYDACVVREAREELGLELSGTPPRLFRIDACPATGQEFVWVYRTEAAGPFALNPEEIAEGRWFAAAEVDRLLREEPDRCAPVLALIWARLRCGGEPAGEREGGEAGE